MAAICAHRFSPGAEDRVAPGTLVTAPALVRPVFADARHGFALAHAGQLIFPAATVDGGRTWRINGPPLPLPAPTGLAQVTQSGVAGPRKFFTSEGLGGMTVVGVTNDAGKHWWQALIPGGPVIVDAFRGELTAIVARSDQGAPSSGPTFWAFHSKTGRRWTYETSFKS